MSIINDMSKFDGRAFMKKVSEVAAAMEENSKDLLKKKFENSVLLSDKQACYSYALLMKWNVLAAYFACIINSSLGYGGANG